MNAQRLSGYGTMLLAAAVVLLVCSEATAGYRYDRISPYYDARDYDACRSRSSNTCDYVVVTDQYSDRSTCRPHRSYTRRVTTTTTTRPLYTTRSRCSDVIVRTTSCAPVYYERREATTCHRRYRERPVYVTYKRPVKRSRYVRTRSYVPRLRYVSDSCHRSATYKTVYRPTHRRHHRGLTVSFDCDRHNRHRSKGLRIRYCD